MGSLFKPKLTPGPATPPAANPPVFASVYSRIAGSTGPKKKKPTAADAGFGDGGTHPENQQLATATPTATPSLLG